MRDYYEMNPNRVTAVEVLRDRNRVEDKTFSKIFCRRTALLSAEVVSPQHGDEKTRISRQAGICMLNKASHSAEAIVLSANLKSCICNILKLVFSYYSYEVIMSNHQHSAGASGTIEFEILTCT